MEQKRRILTILMFVTIQMSIILLLSVISDKLTSKDIPTSMVHVIQYNKLIPGQEYRIEATRTNEDETTSSEIYFTPTTSMGTIRLPIDISKYGDSSYHISMYMDEELITDWGIYLLGDWPEQSVTGVETIESVLSTTGITDEQITEVLENLQQEATIDLTIERD